MADGEAKLSLPCNNGAGAPGGSDSTASGGAPARRTDRGQRPPPANQRVPVELRDLDMRIARDGTWFYRGSPIARQALVKLFASVLRRGDDGSYWLVTPAERGRVIVDDAPFVAVELSSEGTGRDRRLSFRTNLDDIVAVGPNHPLRVATAANGEPTPYVVVRPGLEARLNRPVFYELVELADAERGEGKGQFGLWSGGMFFDLGDPEDS